MPLASFSDALTPGLFLWEAVVALSLLGLGLGTSRLLRRAELPFALALTTGTSVWLAVGGPLNLFGLATRLILIALLLPGLLCLIAEVARPATRTRWRAAFGSLRPPGIGFALAVAPVALWLALATLAHIASLNFNRFDDLPGYLAFALKASALGGLQPDPFSERRVTSGVGGSLFLNITMLSSGQLRAVDFLEGAFGFVAFLLAVLALTRRFGLGRWSTLLVVVATAFFTLGRANLSSVNLSAALFLSLLLLTLERPEFRSSDAALVGFLLAGAFCLKSSNIPFCALFLLFVSIAQVRRARNLRPLVAPALAGLVCLLVAAPWACKHLRDEGTLLFPTLGRGDHLSTYGFPSIAATGTLDTALLASLYPMLLPVAGCLFSWRLARTSRGPAAASANLSTLPFFAAAALAAPLFAVPVAAADLDRFLLPVEVPCALLFLCLLLASIANAGTSPAASLSSRSAAKAFAFQLTALLFFLLWSAGFGFLATNESFFRDLGDVAALFGQPGLLRWYEDSLSPATLRTRAAAVARAQAAVPAGATLLETIDDAWAFSWHRNPVLLADYPGMSSPAPGLPLDGTPADLRTYLLAHGIHFVIGEHETRMPTDYALFRRRPILPVTAQDIFVDRIFLGYINMEYTVVSRTRALLEALAPGHTVADDGHLFVLKLD